MGVNKTSPNFFYGLEFVILVSLFVFIKKIFDGLEKQLYKEKERKKSHWIKRRR